VVNFTGTYIGFSGFCAAAMSGLPAAPVFTNSPQVRLSLIRLFVFCAFNGIIWQQFQPPIQSFPGLRWLLRHRGRGCKNQ
jgi:hypothetical protein